MRLSSAIDIAGLGSYEMREDYRINFLDARMRQFLGIPTDQETDGRQFWLTHIHPDDLARVLEVSRNVLEGGVDRFAVEYRYIHPDKKIIWFNHLSRVLERDGTGRATHVIGTLQNITGQKRMEIALKESMESYRAMVEAFDGLIYICSQDYRVEYMNKRLVERTGRDAVNELCYEALHDRDSICPWCVNEQVFKGEVVRWEVQSPKDQAWYYVVNSPIQHSNGTFSKLAMILDITKRKLMEESLRENEVILRNNQKDLQRLAGGLIRVKEEELRRLSRELHDDLTQRLAVIAIEAGKLEMHLKEPEMSLADQVEKIALIKKQLIRVSEDVHRISRQLHPTILEDLGLVRAIESECAAFRQTGDLEVVFSQEGLPENIPTEISLCLYRIIQEGLKNILRHGAANSCEVLLQSVDGAVHLTVRDDGTGFDPEEVGHKPGLGLSSMRERVLLVQGDFAIDTAPGRGTTINVTIPFKTGAT